MDMSSSSVSPSGSSMVVQKKSRPPMSEAPSISTPFLPPSLMIFCRSFSASFFAAAAAFSSGVCFGCCAAPLPAFAVGPERPVRKFCAGVGANASALIAL